MVEKRSTSTTSFGTSRREGHDASAFYDRFMAPELSDSTDIGRTPALLKKLGRGKCYVGDSAAMSHLPDNSVALVITSPPYFVGKEYELAVTGEDGGNRRIPSSYVEFLDLLKDVFAECVRVLEPGGRIAVNVANLGRKPYRSLSADIIGILQDELGLLLRGEVVWRKAQTAGGSCAWGSFAKASNPVLRDNTERVIIASKGAFSRALTPKQRAARDLPFESTISNDEFIDVTNDVWEIPPESATRVGHPAPFPIELPRRLIDLYTYTGDVVLDPFLGSGTTVVAAARTGRVGVGYDTDKPYVDLAKRRLKAEIERADKIVQVSSVEELDVDAIQLAFDELEPDERQEAFQARAVREGKRSQKIAESLLEAAGFPVIKKDPKVPSAGLVYNFKITSEDGSTEWWVDVSGAFTSSRPGLMRTDTVWKMLGRLQVLRATDQTARLLVLTSNLPKPGSPGDKAMRAVSARNLFDVLELFDPKTPATLKHYASQAPDTPLPGFWSAEDATLAATNERKKPTSPKTRRKKAKK